eukprot:9647366-Heterocapsa_arctica.AAC.1
MGENLEVRPATLPWHHVRARTRQLHQQGHRGSDTAEQDDLRDGEHSSSGGPEQRTERQRRQHVPALPTVL